MEKPAQMRIVVRTPASKEGISMNPNEYQVQRTNLDSILDESATGGSAA